MASPKLRHNSLGRESHLLINSYLRFKSPEICAEADPHSPPQGVEKTDIGITDLGSNPDFVLYKWCDLEQVINYSELGFLIYKWREQASFIQSLTDM